MIAWCAVAVALAAMPEDVELDAGTSATARPPEDAPFLRVMPGTVKPGDPVLVVVQGASRRPSGSLGKRRLRFYSYRGRHEAVSALPVEHPTGTLPLVVKIPRRGAPTLVMEASVDVVDPGYPRRELDVARKFISPPPEARERITQDREAFRRAWRTPFGPRLFRSGFAWPRPAAVTAPFGDLRMFNGRKKSQHYGTDLDGSVGDPVQAANDGVVVMVRDCFGSGNTVIVNHGGGLLTAYFHLSRFLVEAGEEVKRGQVLGLVGKTGRVTGPHLHWAVRADSLYVDGETLLELDFGA